MASGRFLSVSVAEDDKLSKLSMAAELIYIKTIPHLDRDGMILGKPGFLWGKVCPLREELFGQTQGIIDEWVQVGLVIRFITSEGPALFFPGFAKNNNLPHYERERASRFPAPPGYVRTEKGLVPERNEPANKPVLPSANGNHAQVQDSIQDTIQDSIQEFKLQEQEQEQDKDKEEVEAEEPASPAAATDSDTARVWAKWNANMPGVKTPVIVDAVNELLTEYSAWEIEEAITIACKRNKRYLSYVQGILAKGVGSPPPQGGNGHVPAIKADRTSQAFANVRRELEERGILQ